MIDLPDTVPLFPLSGAVLLPRTRLPLQIYEPRYLQMVEDVLKTSQRLIAIIQPMDMVDPRSGDADTAQPDSGQRLAQIGCVGRIVSFSELDDNRLMISLKAISRFRLTGVQDGFLPYLRGRLDWGGFESDLDPRPESCSDNPDRHALIGRLARYAEQRGLTTDWQAAETSDEELLVNSLSMLLPFSAEEKQALLECPTLAARRELLDGLLEYALLGGDDEDKMQ